MIEAVERICVVGNSGSEIGNGRGKIIDSYDVVFRFNNYSVDDDFSPDYGRKTTHWVTTFAKDIVGYEDKDDISQFYCPLPLYDERFLSRYCFTSIPHYKKYRHKTQFIPLEYFLDLTKVIRNPSTGISFLYWLYRERGSIDRRDIFGFSFFDQNYRHHYFDEFSECGHSGLEEKMLYERISFLPNSQLD